MKQEIKSTLLMGIARSKERRRCYLHFYCNAHATADNFDEFTEELDTCKQELESDKVVKGHEDSYKDFFIIKETPVRGQTIQYNSDVIQKNRNHYTGFYTLLTDDFKDPVEALRIYRDKDVVEKCFDDLKNQLYMKRLRVHTSPAMDGRLFVQFIALIYMSALRREMRKSELIEKYTVQELLGDMETLTKIRYSSKYGHILTEIQSLNRSFLKHCTLIWSHRYNASGKFGL